MQIAQIIPDIGIKSGGPSRSVYNLSRGLRDINIISDILTMEQPGNPSIEEASWIKKIHSDKIHILGYNPKYASLLQECGKYDIYHIHSLYNYATTKAMSYALKHNIPYIVSPRGTLYKNAQNKSYIKKLLFNKLALFYYLKKAAIIQVTSQEEMEELRHLGIKTPVAIIPNFLDYKDVPKKIDKPNKFVVGFIGRINRIKNIESLIKAWNISCLRNRPDAEMIIIGEANTNEEYEYKKELLSLVENNNINNINWVGYKFGKEKEELIRTFSVMVLPSHSENFGMVIPEVMLHGVPVIAARTTPWAIVEEENCGWWTNNNATSISETLEEAYNIDQEKWEEMSTSAQRLVINSFSKDSILKKQIDLYNWVINNRIKPNFVYE